MQNLPSDDKAPLWVSGLLVIGVSLAMWAIIIGAVYSFVHN